MSAVQVRQILDSVREIHHSLAARYRELSSETDHDRLKLLFDDVAIREERFAAVVNGFENAARDEVLTTWLQFVPEDVVKFTQAVNNGPPFASLEEAIEHIQQVNRVLGDAYRKVAGETECADLRDLFRNLATLEENNDRHLSKILFGE